MGTDKNSKPMNDTLGMPNKPVIIRKCTEEDLDGVMQVNLNELPEDYPYFFYKSLLDNFGDAFLVACDQEGKVVGYIMWRVEKVPSVDEFKIYKKGHLVSIAVSKDYRRLGIATTLLTMSMKEIKKYGIDEYVLEVRVSNTPAISLYKKFNFSIHSIKYAYYRDGENAYYMIRKAD
ncbi:MAG: GNAT family N-acetyltransferase [Promethearchaeota archaeon]